MIDKILNTTEFNREDGIFSFVTAVMTSARLLQSTGTRILMGLAE